jgi:pimeloyl-ACP methyl ester carboxylesterase
MDGSGRLFERIVRELQGECVTVVYPPNQALGYGALERHVRTLLPTDRPYVLVAESFAGPLAIRLAASSPPMLQALVLACTFVKSPLPNFGRALHGAVARLPVWAAPTALAAQLLFNGYDSPALRALFIEAIQSVNAHTWRARMRAVLDCDVMGELRQVAVPCLYLQARNDRIVPRRASELIARLRPATQMIELDAPHFLLQTRPREAAGAIHAFIGHDTGPTDPSA